MQGQYMYDNQPTKKNMGGTKQILKRHDMELVEQYL